jgi:hypothetical protein
MIRAKTSPLPRTNAPRFSPYRALLLARKRSTLTRTFERILLGRAARRLIVRTFIRRRTDRMESRGVIGSGRVARRTASTHNDQTRAREEKNPVCQFHRCPSRLHGISSFPGVQPANVLRHL